MITVNNQPLAVYLKSQHQTDRRPMTEEDVHIGFTPKRNSGGWAKTLTR